MIAFAPVTLLGQSDSTHELRKVTVYADPLAVRQDQLSAGLRTSTPIQQLPQNIEVVSAKLLRDQQVFDMLEGVTRNVSGVSRTNDWDNYAHIVMRGAMAPAYRNGMNIQMPWGPVVEDISMIDRIEFVKGPAGFMLSHGEPGGFYNVVTKKPTGQNQQEIAATLGSFQSYRLSADLDGTFSSKSKLWYRLNVMAQEKKSYRDFDFNNRFTFFPAVTYRPDDKTDITAEFAYQYMQMAMIGSANVFSPKKYGELPRNFSTLEPNLDPSSINDESAFLTLHHAINADWKFTAQLAWFHYTQQGYTMWVNYPDGLQQNGDLLRSIGNWDALNRSVLAQAYLSGTVHTGQLDHHVLAGLDMGSKKYYADYYQSSPLGGYDNYSTPVTFNVYAPVHGYVPAQALPHFDRSLSLRQRGLGTAGEDYSSLYVQDEMHAWRDRVRLTLALRYTSLRQESYGVLSDDGRVTPRAGISVTVATRTDVYALYDQAFAAQQGIDSVHRKPLVPVLARNLEAGVKQDFGSWRATASVYRIVRNHVVSVIPEPYTVIQTGQTTTRGIEMDVKGEIVKGLSLVWNYAYTDEHITKDEDATNVGKLVPGIAFPQHITNAWLSYHVSRGTVNGLGASIGYQYQARRKVGDSRTGGEGAEQLPDYFRMDASLSYASGRYFVNLTANNILNKYLYNGSPFEFDNNPSTVEYYYQIEAGINFRLSFGLRF